MESDDSDFEFDGVRTKKVSKTRKKERERKVKGTTATKETNHRRRTHADNIPDSEKPFACDCKKYFLTLK